MLHGLSQSPVDLVTFGWEAHGEPLAALRFFATTKMLENHALSKSPIPFQGKPTPCKPIKGEGIRCSRFSLGFGWMSLEIGLLGYTRALLL